VTFVTDDVETWQMI